MAACREGRPRQTIFDQIEDVLEAKEICQVRIVANGTQ